MAKKKAKSKAKRRRPGKRPGSIAVAEKQPLHKPRFFYEDDVKTIHISGLLLVLILICTIWWNRFLPMQDYPQHLFMVEIANTYDDPSLGWAENFELRNQFGPYRATYLAQRALGAVTDVITGGKILATLYVLLVGLLAYRVCNECGGEFPRWGALLFFPFCLHPMYFYGFFNFTISIPVLLLTLLDMRTLISSQASWKSVGRHVILQMCLFLLHPFTLLVYIVLAFASIALLARDRWQFLRGISSASLALFLFLGWTGYTSMITAPGDSLSLFGLKSERWPLEWNLSFLAMSFTGMRFTRDPHWLNWLIAAFWATLLLLPLLEYWRHRRESKFSFWFPVLFCMAVGGYFVLPFSIQTDGRYTFFNVRMAPIFFFLLVPIVATLPIGRFAGRVVVLLCLILTCYSAYLHDRVSNEIEGFVPIFDKMEKNATVLTLFATSPSAYLDPFFYNNFHQCFPFYYHILKGGGVNPDMFNRRLMPIGFREGKRPGRPSQRELHKWVEYRAAYDYVIARQVPRIVYQQLDYYGDLVDSAGPWSLYKLR